ncbi:MAG: flagellar biosynthesis protein FlhB [Chthonomonas sp.]|nr:flagellar biosynthesis protein FlhB [Chthonomonas sp.]
MAENQSSGEKTEEPTLRRKSEARKQGTVAKSTDLTGALTLLAVVAILPTALGAFGKGFVASLHGTPLPTDASTSNLSAYVLDLLKPSLLLLATIGGTAMAVGLAANFAQVGFHLSAAPLEPKFEKINPVSGFKRIASKRAVVEGLKTLFKGLLFGFLAYDAIRSNWTNLLTLSWNSPSEAAIRVGALIWAVAIRVAVAWLVMATLDYFFQRNEVNKQLRMTKDEVKREMKEMEGSPEIRIARMQRMRKMSRGRTQEMIKSADVIITNPTHFAVAIQYDRSSMHAPMVVAKGQDYLAFKIREIAEQHKVPIVPNPPLARALYKQCDVGDFIPRDHFAAVAEVLAHVYRTIKKLR